MKIPKWLKPKNNKDLMHYIAVWIVIAASGIEFLFLTTGVQINEAQVWSLQTLVLSVVSLLTFYVADKIAHKTLGVD